MEFCLALSVVKILITLVPFIEYVFLTRKDEVSHVSNKVKGSSQNTLFPNSEVSFIIVI